MRKADSEARKMQVIRADLILASKRAFCQELAFPDNSVPSSLIIIGNPQITISQLL